MFTNTSTMKLGVQLILLMTAVLGMTILVFSILDYSEEYQTERKHHIDQSRTLLRSLATSIQNNAYNKDYSTIEEKLASLIPFENLKSILFLDMKGNIVTEVIERNNKPLVTFRTDALKLPQTNVVTEDNKHNLICVWQLVRFANLKLGWLRADIDREQIKQNVFLVTQKKLVINLIIFLVGIVSVYLFTSRKLASLKTLSDFSERISIHPGEQLQGKSVSKEIDYLREKMNLLSAQLEKHRKEIAETNQQLEQRVQERTTELLASKQEAEKANMAKTEFLSCMSHELRTPLNAVLGFTQLLKLDHNALTQEHSEYIEEILRGANLLLELVNQVLDLSKIESGNLDITMSDIDLVKVIRNIIAMLQQQASASGIEIIFNPPEPTEYWIHADELRIRQILLNLITNAIKYNRPDGRVTIELKGENGNAVIAICDTGIGIKQNELEYIFQPFYRVASRINIEGTGIGLSVTKSLVEILGGTISVSSQPDAGSCFTLSFPRNP